MRGHTTSLQRNTISIGRSTTLFQISILFDISIFFHHFHRLNINASDSRFFSIVYFRVFRHVCNVTFKLNQHSGQNKMLSVLVDRHPCAQRKMEATSFLVLQLVDRVWNRIAPLWAFRWTELLRPWHI